MGCLVGNEVISQCWDLECTGKRYILRLCLGFAPWGIYGKGDEVICADLCYIETR